MFDSIVIGGGISGLTAALKLSKAGKRIALVEPHAIGGMIQSSHIEGFTLEQGPNVLVDKEHLSKLIDDVGLTPQVVYPVIQKFRQLVWWHGAPTSVPRGPIAFIATPLIPFKDKFRLLSKLFKPGVAKPAKEDESVSTFFSRILGEEGVRNMLDPALRGIFGGDISKLSAKSLFSDLWDSMNSGASLFSYARSRKGKRRVFVLRGGMNVLIRAIEERLSEEVVRYEQKVGAVTYNSGIFEVSLESGEILSSKSLFVATSGSTSATFLESLDPKLAEMLNSVRYAPLAVVHCSVNGDQCLPPKAFGILFPSGKAAKVLGVMFNSCLFPHTAPRGKHLLTVCVGGVEGMHVCKESDISLQGTVREELLDKLSLRDPEFLSIVRWERAIPQYEIGFSNIVDRLKLVEQQFPGLHFIGSEIGGVGVPDRVRKASNAVEDSL